LHAAFIYLSPSGNGHHVRLLISIIAVGHHAHFEDVESVGIKFSGDVSGDFNGVDRRVELIDGKLTGA